MVPEPCLTTKFLILSLGFHVSCLFLASARPTAYLSLFFNQGLIACLHVLQTTSHWSFEGGTQLLQGEGRKGGGGVVEDEAFSRIRRILSPMVGHFD